MLATNSLTKIYDGKTVLNKINFSLKENEVVALIGNNGEGKSTLLKILAGKEKPDEGSVSRDNDVTGYLPQHPEFGRKNVKEFLLKKLKDPQFAYKIQMNLARVGLEGVNEDTLCVNLSGGQRTKLYLAAILLTDPEPNILLLDEPTNNLDVTGLIWLENFINDFQGSVLLTSHDRSFLDHVTDRIAELHKGNIKVYGGNYSFYREQKDVELEAQERAYTTQQTKIKKIEEDIFDYKQKALQGERKFTSRDPYQKKKAGKAARTAIVRQRKLEKLLDSEDLISKPEARKNMDQSIEGTNPAGKKIFELKNVSKSYEGKSVLSGISLSVFGKEHIWVRGPNGSGKTTLLKILAGKEKPDTGEVVLGTNIKVAYFSQDPDIDTDKTGIDTFLSSGADPTTCFISAAHMHLSEDDLRKKLKLLSRGQISKIGLISLLLSDLNLLILDEPTNHLEIDTREDIENALNSYRGALITASHDRYFIEKIGIDRVIEL